MVTKEEIEFAYQQDSRAGTSEYLKSIADKLLAERDEALAKLETSNWIENNIFVKAGDINDPKHLRSLLLFSTTSGMALQKELKLAEAKAEAYREVAKQFRKDLFDKMRIPYDHDPEIYAEVDAEAARIIKGCNEKAK